MTPVLPLELPAETLERCAQLTPRDDGKVRHRSRHGHFDVDDSNRERKAFLGPDLETGDDRFANVGYRLGLGRALAHAARNGRTARNDDAGLVSFQNDGELHVRSVADPPGVVRFDGLRGRPRSMLKLAVLISGTGSNLRAILRAIDEKRCHADVVAVIADRDAAGLALATERGIASSVVRPKDHADRAAWDTALAAKVASFSPDLVVCAGFMRIVGPAMIAAFPHRIVNVHPALLPSFPGTDGAAQAIAKGVRIAGCTVHLVDAGVDTGPILAQAAVPVLPSDDAHTLQARIQTHEHRLLPAVIDAVARGVIVLGERPTFTTTDAFAIDDALVSPHLGR